MAKTSRKIQDVSRRTPLQNVAAFAEFIRGELERQRLSSYTIEERVKNSASGLKIDHSTVWRIANQRIPEIRSTSVAALAVGLGLPVEKLQDVLFSNKIEVAESEVLEVTLPTNLFTKLSEQARLHRRSNEAEVEAILAYVLSDEDVNIDAQKISRIRKKLRIVK